MLLDGRWPRCQLDPATGTHQKDAHYVVRQLAGSISELISEQLQAVAQTGGKDAGTDMRPRTDGERGGPASRPQSAVVVQLIRQEDVVPASDQARGRNDSNLSPEVNRVPPDVTRALVQNPVLEEFERGDLQQRHRHQRLEERHRPLEGLFDWKAVHPRSFASRFPGAPPGESM